MKRSTSLYLAAGALALFGLSALASYSVARPHGGPGMGHHGEFGMGPHGAYHKWGRRGHHRKGGRRLMERFDTNGDNKLTQQEINDKIKDMHAKGDENRDGSLTLKEFESVWLEMMRQRMVRRFQRLDADGDAKVTLAEAQKPLGNIVEWRDRNGDGVLDKNDRRRGWGKWRHRYQDDRPEPPRERPDEN